MNLSSGTQGLIAGAIFDFMGYLTTRPKTVSAGATENPTPVLDHFTTWAAERGLSTERAMVQDWNTLPGMVTIAAAPDFTEDGYWANFSAAQKAELERHGRVELPSDYMEPYVVTKRMVENGRQNLVLRSDLNLPFPVRCLQGTADTAVSTETALRLLDHATCEDMQLTLVKDADHRFSDEACLALIEKAVEEVCCGNAN